MQPHSPGSRSKKKFRHRVASGIAAILTACSGGNNGDGLSQSGSLGEEVEVTNTVEKVSQMSVGDVFYATFDPSHSAAIDFSGVEKSATFIVGVANLSAAGGASLVRVSYDEAIPIASLAKSLPEWGDPVDGAEAFHHELRVQETLATAEIGPAWALTLAKSAGAEALTVSISGKEPFRLLKSISGSTYSEVEGEVVCSGKNVMVYLDATNESDIAKADLQSYCDLFDPLVANERQIFGGESDINGDAKVAVLFTPMVNSLGKSMGGGGMVTGYFYFKDLLARSASNPTSNGREIVYLGVADESGRYGPMIPKDFFLNQFVVPVFIHEFQHAINFNQKSILRGVSESMALNEGLSHFAEDRLFYGHENPSRVELYLDKPEGYPVFGDDSPNLGERGGIYLFLRWLYEQSGNGDPFIWDLLHTKSTGAAAIQDVFSGQGEDFDDFGEYFLRFATSVVMSNFRLSVDPAYSFRDPVFHEETGHFEGAFLVGDAKDGRGTVIEPMAPAPYLGIHSAMLFPTAFKLYAVQNYPKKMVFTAPDAGNYGSFLIRTK